MWLINECLQAYSIDILFQLQLRHEDIAIATFVHCAHTLAFPRLLILVNLLDWSFSFLTDRTNGCAYATVLRLSSVCGHVL